MKIAAMKTGTPPLRQRRPCAIRLAGAGAVMQGAKIATTTSADRMIFGIYATLAERVRYQRPAPPLVYKAGTDPLKQGTPRQPNRPLEPCHNRPGCATGQCGRS